MKWVLIVVLWGHFGFSAEFDSLRACDHAQDEITKGSPDTNVAMEQAFCLPK